MSVDANLDKLIRKHEAGDFISFKEFGKHIFRQLNGSDVYNRVDKINMNNPFIVSPEKTGKKPFSHTDTHKQVKSREVDDLCIERQERHLGGTYVPKKGTTLVQKPGVNQLSSTVGEVIHVESKGHSDTVSQCSQISASRYNAKD